jgi:hypothetical protein
VSSLPSGANQTPLVTVCLSPCALDNMASVVWVWNIQKMSLEAVLEQTAAVRCFQWDPRRPRLALCTGTPGCTCGLLRAASPCRSPAKVSPPPHGSGASPCWPRWGFHVLETWAQSHFYPFPSPLF